MDKTIDEDSEPVEKRAARHITDMRSEYHFVRAEAYDRLRKIDPDRIMDQVIRAHGRDLEVHRGTWRSRSLFLSLGIGVAGYLIVASVATCNTNPRWSEPAFFFGAFCSVFAGFVFMLVKPTLAGEYRRQALSRLLCASEDPRAIGPLCDYLGSHSLRKRDRNLDQVIFEALTRLLPQLGSASVDALTSRQRAVLRIELRRITQTYHLYLAADGIDEDIKLAVAILQYMERFGDTASMADVDRIATWKPDSSIQRVLAEQAQRCLAVLRELQAAEAQGRALLRGSESPTASAELLRQAKSPEANADELLRPSDEVERESSE